MKFEVIARQVKGLRWLSESQGKVLYDHVVDHRAENILELGFHHGVSTMYMAAALDECGIVGSITTIDRGSARDLSPNIEALSAAIGFGDYVHPLYAENCYTWELSKLLERDPRPSFDLVFIDGAHLWRTDALAFFLCDKMLNRDGWIILDDLKWTMKHDADPEHDEWTLKYGEEERRDRQVQKIFDLLVKEHPNYAEFREELGFGFAKKVGRDAVYSVKESVVVKQVLVTREMLRSITSRKS